MLLLRRVVTYHVYTMHCLLNFSRYVLNIHLEISKITVIDDAKMILLLLIVFKCIVLVLGWANLQISYIKLNYLSYF